MGLGGEGANNKNKKPQALVLDTPPLPPSPISNILLSDLVVYTTEVHAGLHIPIYIILYTDKERKRNGSVGTSKFI